MTGTLACETAQWLARLGRLKSVTRESGLRGGLSIKSLKAGGSAPCVDGIRDQNKLEPSGGRRGHKMER